MNLTEIIVAMRIEIQETAADVFLDAELTRGVQKCVALMSRLVPKRAVVETTLTREYTAEDLLISSDTGTLAHLPVEAGSLVITGEVLDTDYTVNYLTGVVTEIGSLLANATYAAAYSLDPHLLDISTLLPEENYIRIERIEYPVGDDPPTYVTFEIFGEFLLIKQATLTTGEHIRVIYLKPWTAPTISTAAALTTALDGTNNDLVFTARVAGTVGNATTIKYTNPGVTHTLSVAVSNADIVVTLGYAAGAINSTAAAVEALIEADSDAVALVSVANASSNDGTGLVTAMAETALTGGSDTGVDGDYPEHLDNAVIIGAVGQTLIFKAEKYVQAAVTAIEVALSAPVDYSIVKPTAPVAPTFTETEITKALNRMSDLGTGAAETGVLYDALTLLTTGATLLTTINDAERVPENYALYAQTKVAIVNGYRDLARERYAQMAAAITLYGHKVANHDAEVAIENVGASDFAARVQKYLAETAEQAMEVDHLLEIAGRYLASGQSKINEFITMLGIKPEFFKTKSSSEQFS